MRGRYEVAIIGAGPAGAAAAFFLAHAGVGDVLLLDRMLGEESFDRYHSICGEGISRRAFRGLEPMEPWHLRGPMGRTELLWPGEIRVERKVEGLILDRPRFLAELHERAEQGGCHLRRGALESVEMDDEDHVLRLRDGREVRCRWLIGADGAFSRVRRDLFGSRPRGMMQVQRFLSEQPAPADGALIELGERYRGGYRWTFPSGDGSNYGFPKGCDSPEEVLDKGGRHLPFGGVGELVRGRAMLLGDAAAQANPVCFAGLLPAFRGAKAVARAIVRDNPRIYSRWWERSLLSSPRFFATHERLRSWSDEDMRRAAHPFRRGVNPLSVTHALLTMPGNLPMYVGCLFTFQYAW